MAPTWNHNNHYHSVLLSKMPRPCEQALDIGCGDGEFARKVASRAHVVVGLDRSTEMIRRAKLLSPDFKNLSFIEGDFMEYPLEPNSYDFVSCLAALHHLPFAASITKIKTTLRPGGVLAILGLYRDRLVDLPHSLLAVVINQIYLRARHIVDRADAAQPPIADPTMTLSEIRRSASELLPTAKFRTHLLWRYSLTWRKT